MLTVTYAIKSVVVRENHKCFNLSSTLQSVQKKGALMSLGGSAPIVLSILHTLVDLWLNSPASLITDPLLWLNMR